MTGRATGRRSAGKRKARIAAAASAAGSCTRSQIERPSIFTASACGLSRLPSQAGQTGASTSSASSSGA